MAAVITLMMGMRSHQANRDKLVSAMLGHKKAPPPTLRDLEMAQSWRERLFKPALGRLTNFGRMLTPARNIEQLQRDLIRAGLVGKLTVTDFLGLRFLIGAAASALMLFMGSLNRPLSSAILYALSLIHI